MSQDIKRLPIRYQRITLNNKETYYRCRTRVAEGNYSYAYIDAKEYYLSPEGKIDLVYQRLSQNTDKKPLPVENEDALYSSRYY